MARYNALSTPKGKDLQGLIRYLQDEFQRIQSAGSAPDVDHLGLSTVYNDPDKPFAGQIVNFKPDGSTQTKDGPYFYDGTTWQPLVTVITGPTPGYLLLYDSKAQGTDGGGADSTLDNVRDIGTKSYDTGSNITSRTLTSFTLYPGTYRVFYHCPFYKTILSQGLLYNKLTGSAEIYAQSIAQTYPQSRAFGAGYLTFSESTEFELHTPVQTTEATDGLGLACNFSGKEEIYSIFEAERIDTDAPKKYVLLTDEKTTTTGGTATAGENQRDLNTIVVNTAGDLSNLSANDFDLAAGTYRFRISAPAYRVNAHQVLLRNVDDTIDYLGTTEYSTSVSNYYESRSWAMGSFTIAAAKTFRIMHEVQTTSSSWGLGYGSATGTNVFTIAEFWKE